MKLRYSLAFFLIVLGHYSFSQNLNVVRNLGQINFADSANLVLSAKVENGKYTYTLKDTKDPDHPIFSFSLVTNTMEAFKENIKSNLTKSEKQISLDESKYPTYFFYFQNQNPFLLIDQAGGEAMEMIFSDTLTIFNFKHKVYSQITREDVLKLLKNISDFSMNIEEFEKKDAFNSDTYKDLKINQEKGSKDDQEKSINTIFNSNQEFKAHLYEIEKGTPKPLRWEKLYQEIQYQYYQSLIKKIDKKINEASNNGSTGINETKKKIAEINLTINRLKNDTTRLNKELRDYNLNLTQSRAKKNDLENQVKLKLTLNRVPEYGFPNNLELQQFSDSAYRKNDSLVRTIPTEFEISSQVIQDFEDKAKPQLIQIFNSDKNNIQQKEKLFKALKQENENISKLETRINGNEDLVLKKIDTLSKENELLINTSASLEKLESEVLDKIKSELTALKNSNKFHFKARELQMEFNRGYLENIVIVGEARIFIESSLRKFEKEIPFPPVTLKFVNDYPIGISAKKDLESLGDIKLYARYQDEVHYEMRIGDLITNIKEILALDRTDYSPVDGKITVDLLTQKNISLKKSPTKEILQLKVFSDFVGLQEENPNGLIQFEVDKEIPLVTKRLTKPYLGPIRFLVNKSGNVGFFNFFRPKFIYSKIEDNNQELQLTSFTNQTSDSTWFGTSTLNIKQFERFSIGTDLNLFLYNIPYGKSTFLVNGGMYYGRTDFAEIDSIPSIKGYPRAYTNTYQPSTEFLWRITGDERYGIELSYGITWVISDQLNFTQRSNTFDSTDFKSFQESNKDYGIQRITLLAYLNLDSNSAGRMFFRYRSNSELGNFKNNFSQLQIGYTTYLTRPSK